MSGLFDQICQSLIPLIGLFGSSRLWTVTKPQSNVHEYALENKIDVFELHLNAEKEFVGRRRNRALDASLTAKARLKDLEAKRLTIDSHTLLCQRPKCEDCSSSLPLRTIAISMKGCWNCSQNILVAVGHKDGSELEQDFFTEEELEFASGNGVILERRFSSTVEAKYLANVCPHCDQIQGNWYLYKDPFHDRFNLHQTEREAYGPCDNCSARMCFTHGEYFDYAGKMQCPDCVREAEKTMCPKVPERQCFYPDKCQKIGCYFQSQQPRDTQRESQRIQHHTEKLDQERKDFNSRVETEETKEDWREFNRWIAEKRADTNEEN